MSEMVLSGGKKMQEKLSGILSTMGATLSVGFMSEATYEDGTPEDGTPVAAVAFWNEFGTGLIPSRPFFRKMIANESGLIGKKLSYQLKQNGMNGKNALDVIGEDLATALKQSIVNTNSPKNADSTIAAKGFNSPLVDTGHMKDSVTHRVE